MRRVLSILTLLLLAGTAQATIVKSLNLEQMTKAADVIVVGEVLARTSAWNEEKTRIYTVTRIRVAEALKGSSGGDEIEVRQIGGTVDGLTQSIVGNAKLKEGEEVVLFLDQDERLPYHYVVGMAQGKFSIDRSGKNPLVVRSLAGLALAKVKDKKIETLKHAPSTPAAVAPTLDAFKAKVRAALQPAP